MGEAYDKRVSTRRGRATPDAKVHETALGRAPHAIIMNQPPGPTETAHARYARDVEDRASAANHADDGYAEIRHAIASGAGWSFSSRRWRNEADAVTHYVGSSDVARRKDAEEPQPPASRRDPLTGPPQPDAVP